MAAWLIRAHHSPGLPRNAQENELEFSFRGVRKRDANRPEHLELITHVDQQLDQLVANHIQDCGDFNYEHDFVHHGLPIRLALSCLVDSDHSDTASYDRGSTLPDPPNARWGERIDALEKYVGGLGEGVGDDSERIRLRQEFYTQCRDAVIEGGLASCTGPVGIGKTTAVMAYLLNTAIRHKLDRIFVVAPYTNIIDQTVKTLRKAVVLPGEDPESVVVAHHHQAEYNNLEAREFSATWKSPIVVTTAVQFFESLSANKPGKLRKLNSLPNAAVFLDEAHASIPTRLWPQCWKWLNELSRNWNCHFVFASGSLIEFWKMRGIAQFNLARELPAIDGNVVEKANAFESKRVRYQLLPEALTRKDLLKNVVESAKPTLAILNTVQSAAVVAKELRDNGQNVLHISTALCPTDREKILDMIKARFAHENRVCENEDSSAEEIDQAKDWILVATSCVEAGVDLSFQTAFRESASVASTIQIGGRVNRHGERDIGSVIIFRMIKDSAINEHPEFKISSRILENLLAKGDFDRLSPSQLASKAMKNELKELGFGAEESPLEKAEQFKDYPEAALLGRVIDSDTRMVVVGDLVRKLDEGERPSFKALQAHSVQLWSPKIRSLGLETAKGFPEIFVYRGTYDSEFIGIMPDLLKQLELNNSGSSIV
jgi:CRISPR-associated endonuclease/helicase Cas3